MALWRGTDAPGAGRIRHDARVRVLHPRIAMGQGPLDGRVRARFRTGGPIHHGHEPDQSVSPITRRRLLTSDSRLSRTSSIRADPAPPAHAHRSSRRGVWARADGEC